MTPAERLLAAADLLDKRAGEATVGPWNVDGPWWWDDTCSALVSAGLAREAVAIAPKGATDGNARYIATMHPKVGKALALVLRNAVDVIESNLGWRIPKGLPPHPVDGDLLDLADLILAGAS
jgi:hypothetical protein